MWSWSDGKKKFKNESNEEKKSMDFIMDFFSWGDNPLNCNVPASCAGDGPLGPPSAQRPSSRTESQRKRWSRTRRDPPHHQRGPAWAAGWSEEIPAGGEWWAWWTDWTRSWTWQWPATSHLYQNEKKSVSFLGNYQIFFNLKESKTTFELFLMKKDFAI